MWSLLLLTVFIVDTIFNFDFSQKLLGDGGVVAMSSIVVA
jgi:hypothetical protein